LSNIQNESFENIIGQSIGRLISNINDNDSNDSSKKIDRDIFTFFYSRLSRVVSSIIFDELDGVSAKRFLDPSKLNFGFENIDKIYSFNYFSFESIAAKTHSDKKHICLHGRASFIEDCSLGKYAGDHYGRSNIDSEILYKSVILRADDQGIDTKDPILFGQGFKQKIQA
jgi:hypothetical protein